MNVQVLLSELLETDARMAALKARRDELRSTLAEEAAKRYAEDGAVPSWKVPRLGTATLAGTDSTETQVTDEAAYAEWARVDRPESVVYELVMPATVVDDHAEALASLEGAPGVTSAFRVHPGVLSGLVASGRADPDAGKLIAEDGQIIPGVRVSRKEPYLSVRLTPEAKRRALAQVAGDTESKLIAAEAAAADDLPANPEFHDDNGEEDRRRAQAAVGSPGAPEAWEPAPHMLDDYVDPF